MQRTLSWATAILVGVATLSPLVGLAAQSGPDDAVTQDEGPTLPADLLDQFPSGAQVLDVKDMSQRGNGRMAVLLGLPNPGGPPDRPFPPQIELAIVFQNPTGWRVAMAVRKAFALAPTTEVADIAGTASVALSYYVGANSQGMLVVRGEAVVYDGVADSVILQDVDGDGVPEVVKRWSPFCQSHASSPRLSTVYAWRRGEFEVATGDFADVLASDRATFEAAVDRAELSTNFLAWTDGQKACLHDALGYIAQEAGDDAEAQARFDQVAALDPTYDVDAIAKAAAGIPARTSP
ncbi:MAG TPA: hypothetical protein VGK54_16515 [Chloroflexota bacterium]